jgi:hypothetical protein
MLKKTSSPAPGRPSVPLFVPASDDQFVPFAPAIAFQNALLSPVQKNEFAHETVGSASNAAATRA